MTAALPTWLRDIFHASESFLHVKLRQVAENGQLLVYACRIAISLRSIPQVILQIYSPGHMLVG